MHVNARKVTLDQNVNYFNVTELTKQISMFAPRGELVKVQILASATLDSEDPIAN
jgi:hypothetical protein